MEPSERFYKPQEEEQQAMASRSPWHIVQMSRHLNRPQCLDYIGSCFEDWYELHGDRLHGDDPSIVAGFGKFGGRLVCVIGHQKGKTLSERVFRNFGMPHPEGYRKALRVMRIALRLRVPIVTLIDTPGAHPGIEAENRGQCLAIAENLMAMVTLQTPILSIVIGEGGSGGALALGVGDLVSMLRFSIYSVIAPESCAAILWKDVQQAARAAELLRLSAQDAQSFGLVDVVIPEPPGGAHVHPRRMMEIFTRALQEQLDTVCEKFFADSEKGISARYVKWRKMGYAVKGS